MTNVNIEKMKYAVKQIERLNKKIENLQGKIADCESEMKGIEAIISSSDWDSINLPEKPEAS